MNPLDGGFNVRSQTVQKNQSVPSVALAISIFGHCVALDAARLVDDALEEPPYRRIRQRPAIALLRIRQNFLLALGLIERLVRLVLQLAQLDGALRALVEQLDKLSIDFIDAVSPIGNRIHAKLPRTK